jgi:CSLREA domain-containing protein
MQRLLAALLIAALLLPGAAGLSARPDPNAPIMVTTTLDLVDSAPGDGVCAGLGGGCALRAAIQEANALTGPQTIIVPAGDYTLAIAGANENLAASGDLDLADDVVLQGAGAATTIIDAGGLDRVLSVISTTVPVSVTISGLTLRNGDTINGTDGQPWGGALLIGGGNRAQVSDSVIRDSSAGIGGGVFVGGELSLLRTSVLSNTASDGVGGGIALLDETRAVTITNSTIAGNVAGRGGGIFKQGGTLTIVASLISGNLAPGGSGDGGGLLNNAGGPATIINTTFSGNRSVSGGAVFNDGFSQLTLINSTITANVSLNHGGGTADVHGADDGMLRSYNTIIAGNSPTDCYGPLHSLGHTLLGPVSNCLYAAAAGDRSGLTALLLGPLADNGGPTLTHALLPGSPAIDAGGSADCPDTDQRERARGALCDIGAYEHDGSGVVAVPAAGAPLAGAIPGRCRATRAHLAGGTIHWS